jgi:hypothetical protein
MKLFAEFRTQKGVVNLTNKLTGEWAGAKGCSEVSYTCGYCGTFSAPSRGYLCETRRGDEYGWIYICPNCNKPTFINKTPFEQTPGPRLGNNLSHLPNDVEQLYNEARNCLSVNAFTASVLSCRKLLMNVAVSKGADAGKSFVFYVNFLNDNHYIPPNSQTWVDHIRNKGNEATHEIPSMTKEDATELLTFTEMLLRFVYELPGTMVKYTQT